VFDNIIYSMDFSLGVRIKVTTIKKHNLLISINKLKILSITNQIRRQLI
jgi:hypothetical protein